MSVPIFVHRPCTARLVCTAIGKPYLWWCQRFLTRVRGFFVGIERARAAWDRVRLRWGVATRCSRPMCSRSVVVPRGAKTRVSAAVAGVGAGNDSVASTVARDFRTRVLWPQWLPRLPRCRGWSTCCDRRRSASFFSVAVGEA